MRLSWLPSHCKSGLMHTTSTCSDLRPRKTGQPSKVLCKCTRYKAKRTCSHSRWAMVKVDHRQRSIRRHLLCLLHLTVVHYHRTMTRSQSLVTQPWPCSVGNSHIHSSKKASWVITIARVALVKDTGIAHRKQKLRLRSKLLMMRSFSRKSILRAPRTEMTVIQNNQRRLNLDFWVTSDTSSTWNVWSKTGNKWNSRLVAQDEAQPNLPLKSN